MWLVVALAWPGVVQAAEVKRTWDVGPTWSVHQTARPKLYTRDGHQYVLYYDDQRYLRLAQRQLGSDAWTDHRFPVQTTWPTGGHARLALAVDVEGHVHVAAYRRGLAEAPPDPPATIYYRTWQPHDLDSLERTAMVAPDEPNPGYPTFIEGPDGTLYFEYRIGGSGAGAQRWNAYNPEQQQWEALPIMLDGEGERSAYGGPRLGPDGRWHCAWVWRETPDAETTHTVAYMRSADLRQWETIDGEPVDLPVTADSREVVVDPIEPGAGLINSVRRLGWDSQDRPVLSYKKYDAQGNSQIYNARHEDGRWRIVQATDWDFRWDFEGRGALGAQVRTGRVRPLGDDRLQQRVYSKAHGWQRVVLDERTLEPIAAPAEQDDSARGSGAVPAWQRDRSEPESDFAERPMDVHWIGDKGRAEQAGTRYRLRWEVGPRNRDQPVPKPWPEPTMLRLYEVRR